MNKLIAALLGAGVMCTAFADTDSAPKIDGTIGREIQEVSAKRLAAPEVPALGIELPATRPSFDMPSVAGIDELECGRKIGYVEDAQEHILESIPWQEVPGIGHVQRVEFHSSNAGGLRLQLGRLRFAEGAQIRLYDPKGSAVLGPFTLPLPYPESAEEWWTPTIFGETLGLEVFVPKGVEVPYGVLAIKKIAYIQCGFTPGATLGCHNDATCFGDWANERDSVARITFIVGAGCGACSGSLMNRQPGDQSPLFYTAAHCVSTQAVATTVEFFWRFEPPSCNGVPPNSNDVPRTLGAQLLKTDPGTTTPGTGGADNTLLGCFEPPIGNWYNGWNAGAWASGDSATGIHHPRGSHKRISFGTTTGSTSAKGFDDDGDGDADIYVNVWDVALTSGTTQPGSSGSPIFDSSHRVRGALTGGSSACPPSTKYWGQFSDGFSTLQPYIYRAESPLNVYVSPWGGGPVENGTPGLPFNGVYEASFCVQAGQDVNIASGSYNERFRIWRPMKLTRWGAGTVRIGAL